MLQLYLIVFALSFLVSALCILSIARPEERLRLDAQRKSEHAARPSF